MANKTKQEARKIRHYRIRNKISGTKAVPRLNVFKSNTNIYAQLIDDENQKTLASSSTKTLNLVGSNIENAHKVGLDIAKKAKDLKVERVVFDRGGYVFHGRVKALADGAKEGGIKI